jgi:hypothetical protein
MLGDRDAASARGASDLTVVIYRAHGRLYVAMTLVFARVAQALERRLRF